MSDWQTEAAEREQQAARERLDRRLRGEAARDDLPLADFLRDVQAAATRAREQFADTACGGFMDRIQECYWTTEQACAQRKANGCPKRIAEYDANLRRYRRNDRTQLQVRWDRGIPGEVALALDGEQQDTDARRIVEGWWVAKPRPRLLLLAGSVGTGKTHAAAALLDRFPGLMVSAHEIRANRNDETYVQRLLIPSLLVIDDLGAEALDGFGEVAAVVERVICARGSGYTVITTNLTLAAFGERYGQRVRDRIKGCGSVAEVAGESMRQTR